MHKSQGGAQIRSQFFPCIRHDLKNVKFQKLNALLHSLVRQMGGSLYSISIYVRQQTIYTRNWSQKDKIFMLYTARMNKQSWLTF